MTTSDAKLQTGKSRLISMLREALRHWQDDNAPQLAAAISFATLFSIAPLAVVATTVAGVLFGTRAAQTEIVGGVGRAAGPAAAAAVGSLLSSAAQVRAGVPASIAGVAALLVGAAGVFGLVQQTLNQIWKVKPHPRKSRWSIVLDRLPSFVMMLAVGAVLLLSLLSSAALALASSYASGLLPQPGVLLGIADFLLKAAIATLLFAAVYKVLPDVDLAWRDVWAGAALTAALFMIGQVLIGLYLTYVAVGSVYGAAGSVIVVLVWIYWSAQVFLLGAELTQVYWARHAPRGRHLRAKMIDLGRHRIARRQQSEQK